jgi:hypothetical protein
MLHFYTVTAERRMAYACKGSVHPSTACLGPGTVYEWVSLAQDGVSLAMGVPGCCSAGCRSRTTRLAELSTSICKF